MEAIIKCEAIARMMLVLRSVMMVWRSCVMVPQKMVSDFGACNRGLCATISPI